MRSTTIDHRRTRRTPAVVSVLACLLVVLPANAQETTLTRPRIAQLLEQAPVTRTTHAQVAVAQAAVTAAGVLSLENPLLSGLGGLRFNEDGTRRFAGTATLSWPIDTGGKRSTRKQAAAAEHHEARLSGEAQRRSLLLEAFIQHATVLRDQHLLAIARAREANTQRVLASALRRRQAGSVPQLDVSLATLQTGRDAAAALAAAGERDASLLRLTAMLGVPPDTITAAGGSLVPDGEPPQMAVMLRAIDQRADVRSATARVQAAQARANRERAAGAPTISLLAQYERDEAANIALLGVAVPLPILNANAVSKATSAAEVQLSKAEHLTAQKQAEAQTRELYTRYHATKRARDALARSAIAAKEAVALAVRAYELGEGDLASVLLVHREALEAERAAIEVEYAHAIAKLELLIVMGRIPP